MKNLRLALVAVIVAAAAASVLAGPLEDRFTSSLTALLNDTFKRGFLAGWAAREQKYDRDQKALERRT